MNEDDLDHEDEFEDEGERQGAFDSRVHFASHGVAAVALLVAGLIPPLALFGLVNVRAMKRLMEETGIALPWPTEILMEFHLPFVGPLLGFLAAGAVGYVSTLRRPGVSLITFACAFLLLFPPAAVGVLHMMAIRYLVVDRLDYFDDQRAAPEPGKTSQIALQVADAVRDGLARGTRSFTTPGGQQVSYFFLSGFGFPEPPSELPAYAEARKHPGCVVLAFGPAGSKARDDEAVLVFPHGVTGGIAPATFDGLQTSPPPWTFHQDNWSYVTAEDTPAFRFPATVACPDAQGYSFSFALKRARTETTEASDSVPSFGYGRMNVESAIDLNDAYSDDLFELRISIFRGFDPGAQPEPSRMTPVIPWANTPAKQFLMLVSR